MAGGVDQHPPPLWRWLFIGTAGAEADRLGCGGTEILDAEVEVHLLG
jgi:hypothetical protein